METNRILKEQVAMLQEALETRKQEWENMKGTWKTMKESMEANKEVIISKATQVDTQISQQVVISEKRQKRSKGQAFQKKSKPKLRALKVT